MDNGLEQRPTERFSTNPILISILVVLLLFSILGINLIVVLGNIIQRFVFPLIVRILAFIGYTGGDFLNASSDVISDTSISGIEIADGAVNSFGDIMKKASSPYMAKAEQQSVDDVLTSSSNIKYTEAVPDVASNPIQQPIAATKQSWCLVGTYAGKKSCAVIGEEDTCKSGQVFDEQSDCLY